MTEREKAFEKARKIYALVQEGIDGEKESARVAFERICRAHGFGEDARIVSTTQNSTSAV